MARLSGVCNCSCKRLDVVEHSHDKTPSSRNLDRAGSVARSLDDNGDPKPDAFEVPKPKELERICCEIATGVPSTTRKVDGGMTYVSRCFEQKRAVAALAQAGYSARRGELCFRAMADQGLVRRVAAGKAPAADLYRFDAEVMPAHMRVIVQSVRLAGVPPDTKTATARLRLAGGAGPWREVRFLRATDERIQEDDDGLGDAVLAPASRDDGLVSLELSADVVRGEAEGPLLDVEMRWCVKGERRVARTSLRTQIYKHHAATLSVTGGYERELELARTTVADRNIRVWYEATVEGMDMRKHFGRVVPPERPLELVDPPQAAADRAAATETAPAFARFFALATPGVEQLRGDSAAVDRRWDRATHDWSVFVRLEDVRGAKLKAEGMLAVMGGNYVVTVGARLREPRSRGGHEVKSAPAAKDWLEHGAEWGAGAEAGADRGGGLIVVHGAARRSTGFLRLNVYERSRTDLFETYQLGHVDVPLLDVPVVRNPAAPPRRPPSAGLRTFPLQRKSLLTGRPSANGEVRASVWMQARTRESATLNRYLNRWPAVAFLATVALAVRAHQVWGRTRLEALFLFLFVARLFTSLEWPRFTGRLLGWGIRQAAPGLDFRVEACTIRADLWPAKDGVGADFRLAADVQGCRIVNAGPDYVRDDFVAAESVRVVLRCDRQILHRAVSLFAEHCRRKVGRLVAKVVALGDVDGDGDVDATDILLGLKRARGNAEDLRAPTALDCAWTVVFEDRRGAPKPGDEIYLKVATTTAQAVALGRTEVVALDDSRSCNFPASRIPLCQLRRREAAGGVVDVFAYRRRGDRADDYLGVVQRCDLADVKQHAQDAAVVRLSADDAVDLKHKGVVVGTLQGAVTISTDRIDDDDEDVDDATAPLVRWKPFPARHHRLVRRAPGAPPTRLATVVIEDLRVRGATVAFGMARSEFNVNRFVRAIDEGKVRGALPARHKSRLPNTLRVAVIKGQGLPASSYVTLSLRRQHRTTATRNAGGVRCEAVFEPHHEFEFPCPDPSAVFVASVVDARSGRIVGRWLVTAKMLVLNAKNVYGGEPEGPAPRLRVSTDDAPGGRARYELEGPMILRGPKGQLLDETRDVGLARSSRCAASGRELTLRVVYEYVENAPTQRDLLEEKPMTALEQLQLNSLETTLRFGDMKLVKRMLDDFPLLFDVRSCQVAEASCYLSELFAGYEGKGESTKHKLNAQRLLDKMRPQDEEDEGVRSHADHIYLPILDLKDACKFEGGLSLGHICKTLMSPQVVSPILNRLDLSHAIAHFAGGGLFAFRGKKKGSAKKRASDVEAEVIAEDGEEGEADDEDAYATLTRNESRVDEHGSVRLDDSAASLRDISGATARERAFAGRRTSMRVAEATVAAEHQDCLLEPPAWSGPLLRSTGPKTKEYPFFVAIYGGSIFWSRLKPDGLSRTGHTCSVVVAGADVTGDASGVRVVFAQEPPDVRAGSKVKPKPPAVIYLRVPDDVKNRAEAAAAWAARLEVAAATEIAEEHAEALRTTPVTSHASSGL